jgi:hypothetical protein
MNSESDDAIEKRGEKRRKSHIPEEQHVEMGARCQQESRDQGVCAVRYRRFPQFLSERSAQ